MKWAKRIDQLCLEGGLLVRMLGISTCVLSPALIISEAEIDKLVGILKVAVMQVSDELAASSASK